LNDPYSIIALRCIPEFICYTWTKVLTVLSIHFTCYSQLETKGQFGIAETELEQVEPCFLTPPVRGSTSNELSQNHPQELPTE